MVDLLRARFLPLTCLGVGLALLALSAPRLPAPEPFSGGDETLQALVEQHRPDASHRLVVGVVGPQGTTFAGFGLDEDSDVEIGSITKAMTGMLLADAVERGEVTPATRLGELLDLGSSPAADIRLEDLATHRAGLPRLPGGPRFLLAGAWANLTGGNPYAGYGTEALVEATRTTEPAPPGTYEYSNFGMALLGHALAARADTTFPRLLEERLTGPLGMHRTYVAEAPEDLSPEAVRGLRANGGEAAPWTMQGFAPTGGVRSTLGDLTLLARAVLDGSAPGMGALDLVDTTDEAPIGLGWHGGTRVADSPVRWHDGGTGGFSGIIALDVVQRRAVIALGDVGPERTGSSVAPLGAVLLTGDPEL